MREYIKAAKLKNIITSLNDSWPQADLVDVYEKLVSGELEDDDSNTAIFIVSNVHDTYWLLENSDAKRIITTAMRRILNSSAATHRFAIDVLEL